VLVDCITGLPIYELTTTADVADSTIATQILEQTNKFLPVRGCTFIADKGYDVKDIYNTVRNVYDGECFIPLNPRNAKDPKKLPSGVPVCDAGLAMNHDGKIADRGRVRQKFCCPFKLSKDDCACPCQNPKFFTGKKRRGCTKYITIPNDYRLSISRNTIRFKETYSLRTECERYNSRFKSTGQERLWVKNKASAQNLNTFAHISLLAVAVAAIVTQSKFSYRQLKSLARAA
jgi:hypothetical protein